MKKLIQNILLIGLIILISGCDNNNLSLPTDKPKIDESLPIVDVVTIKSIPDMTAIALEWKAITVHAVKGYHIYRANIQEEGQKLKRVATIKNKYTSHYLDKNLEPNKQYLYAFSTINKNDFESIASQSIVANTKPRFESVSFITAVNELPRQIKILWRPHSNERVEKYILQRTNNKTAKWKNIKTINSRLEVEYIDKDLKDNAVFSYRIVSITFDGIKSKPSKMVKARTKLLPLNVTNIKATMDQPQKILLTWDILEDISDVSFYYIYSANSQDGYFKKVIKAKADANTYNHLVPSNGTMRFYKITTIDKDSLESLKTKSSTIGKTLDSPTRPVITLAQIQDDTVILNWISSDKRAISYNIYKSVKEGYFSKKTTMIDNVTTLRFEDKDIVRGVTYEYSIESRDEFGIMSEQTPPTSLTIPKLEEIPNAPSTSN